MTFHEAMREAEHRAAQAKSESETTDTLASPYARATGALIVHLANELHDHARTKDKLAAMREAHRPNFPDCK